MPNYWLIKTEPEVYSYADLVRDSRTVWDGVSNNAALMHMRAMQPGDLVLIYHTGGERQAVGLAEVVRAAYPDPNAPADSKLVAVDLAARQALVRPVTLASVKADPFFAEFALVRQARLSVMPVSPEYWAKILTMGGGVV